MREYTENNLDTTVEKLINMHNEVSARRKSQNRQQKINHMFSAHNTNTIARNAFFNPPRKPRYNPNVGKEHTH
eukprot:UN09894